MSDCLAFLGGDFVLPDRIVSACVLVCRDGKISSLSTRKPPRDARVIDLEGGYLSPGYVDMHVHGGGGADFMDGSVEAVHTACSAHLRHGTTTIFPTTTTGTIQQIDAMLTACKQYQDAGVGPNFGGVHLYGPFFAEDKAGCHRKSGRRNPTPSEYDRYFATGLIRIATCAAELAGAKSFYGRARKSSCLVTCGHSNASWTEMQAAFQMGMRHVDHFWCAMSSVASLRSRLGTPMQASMAEFVLMHGDMSTEVIADGCHLSPELLEFAFRMKGPARLCLVTDCNRALDLPPGEYEFGDRADGNLFRSDGRVGWAIDGGGLASSVVGMDHMVRLMKKGTTATLAEVVRMASLTPAERVGIADETGSIEVGKRADLLVLGKKLGVRKVFVRGRQLV